MHVRKCYEKICHEIVELDPCHYISSPEFLKDTLLKMAGNILELFRMMT